MAQYLGSIQPNLNPGTPKVKTVSTQVIIDPLKTIWKCPLCSKSMPYLFRECHVKLHAVFSCPVCREGYSLCDLGPHMIHCMAIYTPDQFYCVMCSRSVDSMRHIKVKHIDSLVCLIPGCRKPFSLSTFMGHVKGCLKSFAKRSPALPPPPPTGKTIKPLKQQDVGSKAPQLKCIFCASCPSTEFLLRKHIEKVHIKHTCPLCKARDIFESNFDEHISKCLKKSSNQDLCPICGQLLANKIDHIHKTHSTLKITCPSCKEKFKCGLLAAHAVSCQRKVASKQGATMDTGSQLGIDLSSESTIPTQKHEILQNNSLKPCLSTSAAKKEPSKGDGVANKIHDIAKVSISNSKPSSSNPMTDVHCNKKNKKSVSFQMVSSQPPDPSSDNELTSLFYESD